MSFKPSLFIQHIFNPAEENSSHNIETEKVIPEYYYKKVVVERDIYDPLIVRYRKDIKDQNCHFYLTQYDKIFTVKNIESPCISEDKTYTRSIVIKTNTKITAHTKQVLYRLLRELRDTYNVKIPHIKKINYINHNDLFNVGITNFRCYDKFTIVADLVFNVFVVDKPERQTGRNMFGYNFSIITLNALEKHRDKEIIHEVFHSISKYENNQYGSHNEIDVDSFMAHVPIQKFTENDIKAIVNQSGKKENFQTKFKYNVDKYNCKDKKEKPIPLENIEIGGGVLDQKALDELYGLTPEKFKNVLIDNNCLNEFISIENKTAKQIKQKLKNKC